MPLSAPNPAAQYQTHASNSVLPSDAMLSVLLGLKCENHVTIAFHHYQFIDAVCACDIEMSAILMLG